MSGWVNAKPSQQSTWKSVSPTPKPPRSAAAIFADDPVDFMSNNFVTPGDGTSLAHRPGLLNFTLTQQNGFASSADRPGAQIKKYAVHPTSKTGPEVFKAYWCPYEDNAVHRITTGRDGIAMFTAVMNGCSFGIGSKNSSGGRSVAHINLKSQTNSHAKQNNILKGMKLGKGMVDPTIYMSGDKPVHVCTFGVRNSITDDWSFYYQLSTVELMVGSNHANNVSKVTLIGVIPVL